MQDETKEGFSVLQKAFILSILFIPVNIRIFFLVPACPYQDYSMSSSVVSLLWGMYAFPAASALRTLVRRVISRTGMGM